MLYQAPRRGPTPRSHHDGHRRGQAERARAGNNQDCDGIDEGMDQARLRALHNPDHKSKRRDENDGWDEVGGDFVRKALYGRPAPLGFPDHAHNLGQQGRAAYTLSPHEKRPGAIQPAAWDLAFRRFFHGVGFTRDHGLIHIARPLDHPPIHGDFLTRPDPQDIARLDAIEWDILLGPTLAPQPRLLWGEPN